MVGIGAYNPEIVGENQSSQKISFPIVSRLVPILIRLAVFDESSDGEVKG